MLSTFSVVFENEWGHMVTKRKKRREIDCLQGTENGMF